MEEPQFGRVTLKGPYNVLSCHTKRRTGARGRAHASFCMTLTFPKKGKEKEKKERKKERKKLKKNI